MREKLYTLDGTLSTFERLSLKNSHQESSEVINFDEAPCKNDEPELARCMKLERFCPYQVPRHFRRRSVPMRRKNGVFSIEPRCDNQLLSIRLYGCNFERSSVPLFSVPPSRLPRSSRAMNPLLGASTSTGNTNMGGVRPTDLMPCWLQHEQSAGYVKATTGSLANVPVNAAATTNSGNSPASTSDSELNVEIDELSEYFHHFVNVRLKMSMQAESMYV